MGFTRPLRFLPAEEFHSEGATFADIDDDQHNDIVSGPWLCSKPVRQPAG